MRLRSDYEFTCKMIYTPDNTTAFKQLGPAPSYFEYLWGLVNTTSYYHGDIPYPSRVATNIIKSGDIIPYITGCHPTSFTSPPAQVPVHDGTTPGDWVAVPAGALLGDNAQDVICELSKLRIFVISVLVLSRFLPPSTPPTCLPLPSSALPTPLAWLGLWREVDGVVVVEDDKDDVEPSRECVLVGPEPITLLHGFHWAKFSKNRTPVINAYWNHITSCLKVSSQYPIAKICFRSLSVCGIHGQEYNFYQTYNTFVNNFMILRVNGARCASVVIVSDVQEAWELPSGTPEVQCSSSTLPFLLIVATIFTGPFFGSNPPPSIPRHPPPLPEGCEMANNVWNEFPSWPVTRRRLRCASTARATTMPAVLTGRMMAARVVGGPPFRSG
ncbi:hypothetical protein FPV67DRAFT_1460069 [Lyophyllum atratum]|nr:hypothetical protein FPV67DRAFT_1460069 [Lyophyllum atratum]